MSENQLGTLIVVFMKARNLPNRRTLGKQNPYCIARIGHDAQRSPADYRGGQTPYWNHEVRYNIMNMREHRVLKLSLLDENDSRPELIGDTTIMLEQAFAAPPNEGFDQWHQLEYRGKYAGEIYIEMTFYPSRPKLPPKKKKTKKSAKPGIPGSRSMSALSSMSMSSMGSSRPLPLQPGQEPQPLPEIPLPIPDQNDDYDQLSYELDQLSVMDGRSSSAGPGPLREDNIERIQRSLPQLPPENCDQCDAHSCPECTPDQYHSQPPPPPPPHASYGNSYSQGYQHDPHPVDYHPQYSQYSQHASQPSQAPQAHAPPPDPRRQVRRKPVNSGLPHDPKFDEGIDHIPFSPDSYETPYAKPKAKTRRSMDADVLKPTSYAPEPLRRPKTQSPQPPDPGLTGYVGQGQWDLSRELNNGYSDSVINRAIAQPHPKPELPPKISLGITPEEHHAIDYETQDYYYRSYT